MCGKIAAGKSTLATKLTEQEQTILLVEDEWLNALFSDQLNDISDYLRCTTKLRSMMAPHIMSLLDEGMSVVLDFSANTVEMRKWIREILDTTQAAHELHLLTPSDEVCLERLRVRNARGDHPFKVSEAEYEQFSKHFMPPTPDEGFNVVVHDQLI
jgi:predicted kinase